MLTKQKTLLERAPWQRAAGKGNPGGLLCQVACNLGFCGEGVGMHCSAKMGANKKDL